MLRTVKCSKCNVILKPKEIDRGLVGSECPTCEGQLFNMYQFQNWLELQKNNLDKPEVELELDLSDDNSKPIRCPLTGGIMIKYRFSIESTRYVEYCAISGSIWFDKGEFKLVKSLGLLTSLPKFFTRNYQKELVQSKLDLTIEEKYEEILGLDYARAKDFKQSFHEPSKIKLVINYLNATLQD